MNIQVEALYKILKIDSKFTATHDFSKLGVGKILPISTRGPERVRFRNGFNPILGVVARIMNGNGTKLDVEPIKKIDVPVETSMSADDVKEMFSSQSYEGMSSSKLLQYLPLSENKESKGEIEIGEFLVDLMDMKNDSDLVALFHETQPNNLYEKVLFELLSAANSQPKTTEKKFQFYNETGYRRIFYQDVHNLQNDKNYFYEHIAELLEFYYFIYTIQTITRISDGELSDTKSMIPLYFTVEDESVSRSRQAVRNGYRITNEHDKSLLVDADVLSYLNVLIPDDNRFYWKNEICADDFSYKVQLQANLNEFLPLIYEKLNNTSSESSVEKFLLKDAIEHLRILMYQRSKETGNIAQSSRYALSFQEIAKQDFIRQHGRLGYTFTLNNRTILMLVTAIVGHGRKTVSEVFKSFNERGVWFDRISRDKIIELFEQANILEKLSDSGDAQYVRGVL